MVLSFIVVAPTILIKENVGFLTLPSSVFLSIWMWKSLTNYSAFIVNICLFLQILLVLASSQELHEESMEVFLFISYIILSLCLSKLNKVSNVLSLTFASLFLSTYFTNHFLPPSSSLTNIIKTLLLSSSLLIFLLSNPTSRRSCLVILCTIAMNLLLDDGFILSKLHHLLIVIANLSWDHSKDDSMDDFLHPCFMVFCLLAQNFILEDSKPQSLLVFLLILPLCCINGQANKRDHWLQCTMAVLSLVSMLNLFISFEIICLCLPAVHCIIFHRNK